MKKGDISVETVAKLLVIVAVLVILIFIVYSFNNKSIDFMDKIKILLRFG